MAKFARFDWLAVFLAGIVCIIFIVNYDCCKCSSSCTRICMNLSIFFLVQDSWVFVRGIRHRWSFVSIFSACSHTYALFLVPKGK